MTHPLAGKALYIYMIVWALILAAHTVALHLSYDFSLSISIVDALLFNLSLMMFGFGYWFVVRFMTSSSGVTASAFNQIMAVVIGVALLTFLSNAVLKQLWANQPYELFLSQTLAWRLFVGCLYIGLVVMVYHLLIYNSNLKEKEKEEVLLQSMLRQSELEMLKFQLNPHFIFNSLNSISSLTINAPEQAREMVIKLSDFLRQSLGKDQQEMHTLEQEMQQMNLYLDIEKVRFEERLRLSQQIDDRCMQQLVPSMMLQPIYENAIKHGIYEQLETVNIHTKTHCEEGYLFVEISNGFDPMAAPQKGKGIGLSNVQSRLELVYGRTDLLSIVRDKKSFTVKIKIPQAS